MDDASILYYARLTNTISIDYTYQHPPKIWYKPE